MSFDILTTFAIATLFSLARAQNSTCYTPDGIVASFLFPCTPDASASACCYAADNCYSNGLCAGYNPDALTPFYWQGCTDPDFRDPACFQKCRSTPGTGVQACQNDLYCCYGFTGCNCSDTSQLFGMNLPTSFTSLGPTLTNLASSSRSVPTTSSNTLPPTPSESTSVLTTSSSNTPDSSSSSSAFASGSSLPTQSSSNKSASESEEKNKNVPIGVGVGVGVPACLAFIGLAWFLGRRSQKKANQKKANLAADMREAGGGEAFNTGGGYDREGPYYMGETYGAYPKPEHDRLELPSEPEASEIDGTSPRNRARPAELSS